MPIQVSMPGWAGQVWLDNQLEVYMASPNMRWMIGKDFYRTCAKWIKRKGGSWKRLKPSRQMELAI